MLTALSNVGSLSHGFCHEPLAWKVSPSSKLEYVPGERNICGAWNMCHGWGSWEVCDPHSPSGDRDVVQGKGRWGQDQLGKLLKLLWEEHLPWDIGVTPGR